jgi:hypothetical protein
MRQFVYGLLLGALTMYCYERVDPPKILAYLNGLTEYAVGSTHGYGGTHERR